MAKAYIYKYVVQSLACLVEGMIEGSYFSQEITAAGDEPPSRFNFTYDLTPELLL